MGVRCLFVASLIACSQCDALMLKVKEKEKKRKHVIYTQNE